jgi:hypothetical protein
MEKIDAKAVKERIMRFMGERGPGLPVQIAKAVSLNTIFTSAFLSELASDGTIKISSMKVGGSPLYFIESKKAMLENFIQHLNPKEIEAVKLLKEKSFLADNEQHPAIRVALRGLKDFAFPINTNGKLVWRYFLVNESNMPNLDLKGKEIEVKEEIKEIARETQQIIITPHESPKASEDHKENINLDRIKKELEERKEEIEKLKQEILVKSMESAPKEKKVKEKKNIKPQKIKDEGFLNEVKEKLMKKNQEIINVEEFDKKYALIRIKQGEREILVAAFDKKRIEESDLIRVYKKAALLNLAYSILFKGEIAKKSRETIEVYKKLNSIEKLE